jgi:cytochrome d ubiquinol oxidase subunit I
VPAGTGLFTLLGFAGLYVLLGLIFVVLMLRIVNRGPHDIEPATTATAAASRASDA